jgi:hypothetical protein
MFTSRINAIQKFFLQDIIINNQHREHQHDGWLELKDILGVLRSKVITNNSFPYTLSILEIAICREFSKLLQCDG